jgi:chromosome segregation ATPase
MTESPVAPANRRPYDLPMEDRVARLEDDMQEVKSVLSRLEPMIVRIDATLTATLPNLATKAEVADLRTDLTREISGLRAEVAADVSGLRSDATALRAEMTTEIGSLRSEMKSLRAEMTTEIGSLRGQTTKEIADLRSETTKEIAALRTEMIARFADVPTKTYLWGILGVLITAYGSGLAALAILK